MPSKRLNLTDYDEDCVQFETIDSPKRFYVHSRDKKLTNSTTASFDTRAARAVVDFLTQWLNEGTTIKPTIIERS